MGHNVRNFMGAAQKSDLVGTVRKLAPGYMPMGTSGMADMAGMAMPAPANTLTMMIGTGQCGPIEMWRLFTVIEIREALATNDYMDPGPYGSPGRHRGLRSRRDSGQGATAKYSEGDE
jgi:manganese oxidase